jgi:hypothetical protein
MTHPETAMSFCVQEVIICDDPKNTFAKPPAIGFHVDKIHYNLHRQRIMAGA